MKLLELNPKWNEDHDGLKHYLVFDCPAKHDHNPGTEYAMKCEIVLPVKTAQNWRIQGSDNLETLTISPSIWHHCDKDPHFFITNGEIVFA